MTPNFQFLYLTINLHLCSFVFCAEGTGLLLGLVSEVCRVGNQPRIGLSTDQQFNLDYYLGMKCLLSTAMSSSCPHKHCSVLVERLTEKGALIWDAAGKVLKVRFASEILHTFLAPFFHMAEQKCI